ncbi:MAG: hypothetical protein WAW52_12700 [Methanothrix sp.]
MNLDLLGIKGILRTNCKRIPWNSQRLLAQRLQAVAYCSSFVIGQRRCNLFRALHMEFHHACGN